MKITDEIYLELCLIYGVQEISDMFASFKFEAKLIIRHPLSGAWHQPLITLEGIDYFIAEDRYLWYGSQKGVSLKPWVHRDEVNEEKGYELMADCAIMNFAARTEFLLNGNPISPDEAKREFDI